jgi:biotin synthase
MTTPAASTAPRRRLDRDDILGLLAAETDADVAAVRARAADVLHAHCGDAVHYRGLIEFSNRCAMNCRYCGIRAGNRRLARYRMGKDAIVEAARWCAEAGYGSIVLQSGEVRTRAFGVFVADTVSAIKRATVSRALPHGLGITLCVGEQDEDTYRRFRDAGAHRYLLRIETTHPALFRRIHPPRQTLAARLAALERLQRCGFQVGTGVMIGLPGQTIAMLADDILFFRDFDVDMIGMGPYVPHCATPLARVSRPDWPPERTLRTALLMIAAARIVMPDINIAATTALQAMHPSGREDGLSFGANVIMPQVTPTALRRQYLLYDGKPCQDEDPAHCRSCLERRLRDIGRYVAWNEWGDSRHFSKRNQRQTRK